MDLLDQLDLSPLQAEFLAKVHEQYERSGGTLVDGYAPFCKHIFLPNFVGARLGCLEITDANRAALQSGGCASPPSPPHQQSVERGSPPPASPLNIPRSPPRLHALTLRPLISSLLCLPPSQATPGGGPRNWPCSHAGSAPPMYKCPRRSRWTSSCTAGERDIHVLQVGGTASACTTRMMYRYVILFTEGRPTHLSAWWLGRSYPEAAT